MAYNMINIAHIEKLNDENYLIWANRIESELRSLKIWRNVIEGEEPIKQVGDKAEDSKEIIKTWEEWDDNNAIARNVMNQTMSATQALKYADVKNAKTLWNRIKDEMAAKTEDIQIRCRGELAKLKMKNEETVDEYVNRAIVLKSKSIQVGDEIKDKEIIYFLLEGLRKEFDFDVKILKNDKDKNMSSIRQLLKETEGKIAQKRIDRGEVESASKAKEGWYKKKHSEKKCYKCGMTNHLVKDCRNDVKCFNCGASGHKSFECRRKQTKYDRGKSQYHKNRTVENKNRERINESATLMSELETNVKETTFIQEETCRDDRKIKWTMDSGATSHMADDKEIFINYQEEERNILIAEKGKMMKSKGIGDIRMKIGKGNNFLKIENVLQVPNLNGNLLSVVKIVDHDLNVLFTKNRAEVTNNEGKIIYVANRIGNKFEVEGINVIEEAKGAIVDDTLWHQRLGHINYQRLRDMKNNSSVNGLGNFKINANSCEACTLGKITRKNYKKVKYPQSTRILELWHTDLVGPIETSYDGYSYFMTVVDDFSSMTFVTPLRDKSETSECLINLIIREERQTGEKLKRIRSDNGGEYLASKIKNFTKDNGIKHEFTTSYTPESNGKAERFNRTIIDIARTLLIDAKMPIKFWSESVRFATHVKNRSELKDKRVTPFEIYQGYKPSVVYLKRFGSEAYVHIRKEDRSKMEHKAQKGIMLGYSMKRKGYRIYIPEMNVVKEVGDVKFNESKLGSLLLKDRNVKNDEKNILEEFCVYKENLDQDSEIKETNDIYEIEEELDCSPEMQREDKESVPEEKEMNIIEKNVEPVMVNNGSTGKKLKIVMTKEMRKERDKQIRRENEEQLLKLGVKRSERIKEKKNVDNQANYIEEVFLPKNFQEALNSKQSKEWLNAMKEEIGRMEELQVWELKNRPDDHKILKSKWIYSVKRLKDGTIKKYKARLVATGYDQRPGNDYDETYSPTIRPETIRLLLKIAACKKVIPKQKDVQTAFLHGDLEENIFMTQAPGFEEDDNKVCHLKKSIYGLKQSSRMWNLKLNKILTDVGFTQSANDPCLYFINDKENFLFIGIHVDDILSVGSGGDFEKMIWEEIKQNIDLIDLKETSLLLGIEIDCQDDNIYICQRNYINEILNTFNMSECNPSKTPLCVSTKYDEFENSKKVDKMQYQEIVGKLLYLAIRTRPDINFAISNLSRFNHDPREIHLNGLKKILRYLKGTLDYQLVYSSSDFDIEAYTDASWDSTKDAKSYSGYIVNIGNNLISWRSKKQHNVALSTAESELEAMSEGIKEVIWINDILTELGLAHKNNIHLFCDSTNAISMIKSRNAKTSTKYLNRKCHFIRENVEQKGIIVEHVASELMKADYLTKNIDGEKLKDCIKNSVVIKN